MPGWVIETVAVKVTASPNNDGLTEDAIVVVVLVLALEVKLPVTVAGALGMWKLVLAEVDESKVPPVEVQLLNWKPAFAVAVTGTVAPPAKKLPEAGVTEPSADGEACVVNWYCVLKLAV